MTEKKVIALVALATLALPWLPFAGDYFLHVIILVFVNMVLAMGLNIVPGFTGLLALGYVGFYGIGAYACGLMMLNLGMAFWLAAPLAALFAALCGVILGAPALRLTGDYFAIVTFGFAEMVYLVLNNEIWLTRGPQGLPGIPPVDLDFSRISRLLNPEWDWFHEFGSKTEYLYLAAVMALLVYVIVSRVEDSRLGRAWLAMRDDPLAASCAGVDLTLYKVIAFTVSAGVGGLAGAFYAGFSNFLSPDLFKFWESFLVLCMIVLGGLGSVPGAVCGAAVFTILGELLREGLATLGLPPETRFLFYGLIMILIMRFKPSGFFSGMSGAASPLLARVRERLAATDEARSFAELGQKPETEAVGSAGRLS